MKRLIRVLVVIAFAFSACNESIPEKKVLRAVYVAGREGGVAKYWKNGVPVILSSGTSFAAARGIDVLGDDVYVVGYEYNGVQAVARLWKNGIPISLTDGGYTSIAESIRLR